MIMLLVVIIIVAQRIAFISQVFQSKIFHNTECNKFFGNEQNKTNLFRKMSI